MKLVHTVVDFIGSLAEFSNVRACMIKKIFTSKEYTEFVMCHHSTIKAWEEQYNEYFNKHDEITNK